MFVSCLCVLCDDVHVPCVYKFRVCTVCVLYVVFMTVSVCMCLNIFVCVLCVSRVCMCFMSV